jgi:hypothetical protein
MFGVHNVRPEWCNLKGGEVQLGLTTMEERRHQGGMGHGPTFKIIHIIDHVTPATWFMKVDTTVRTTKSCADPLNLELQATRLETR